MCKFAFTDVFFKTISNIPASLKIGIELYHKNLQFNKHLYMHCLHYTTHLVMAVLSQFLGYKFTCDMIIINWLIKNLYLILCNGIGG